MLITKYLLIRAKAAMQAGNSIAAAWLCEIAADLAADHGQPAQEAAARNAAHACQVAANAHLDAVL